MNTQRVILIGGESLGRGDAMLGEMLMANFLRLAAEEENRPDVICLLNSAVRMTVPGHTCFQHMKNLESLGTTVLVCKTCLEYYDIEEQVGLGKVSNMHEIQSHAISTQTLSI